MNAPAEKLTPIKLSDKDKRDAEKALLHYRYKEINEAITMIHAIMKKNKSNYMAWYVMALVCEEQGDFQTALFYLRKHMDYVPPAHQLFCDLGRMLSSAGQQQESEKIFNLALKMPPAESPDVLFAIGYEFLRRNKYKEASHWLSKSLQKDKDHVKTLFGLSVITLYNGDLENTVIGLMNAEKIAKHTKDPLLPTIYYLLATSFRMAKKFKHAKSYYKKALEIAPGNQDIAFGYVNLHVDIGKYDEAIVLANELREKYDNPTYDTLWATLIPDVFDSEEHIEKTIIDLHQRLDTILSKSYKKNLQPNHSKHVMNFFYLTYQGINCRPVLEKLNRVFVHMFPMLEHVSPHTQLPRNKAQKIKIGIYSEYFFSSVIMKIFMRLILFLHEQSEFDVTLITKVGHNKDALSEALFSKIPLVVLPLHQHAASHTILDGLKLDVLIYTDIGQSATTQLLSQGRFAPIQIALPGIAVTSGVKSIDYYFSADIVEAPDADTYYTEKLVRFKQLPAYYEKAALDSPSALDKEALEMSPTGLNYVVPMLLQKVHPNFDQVILTILEKDPDAHILLFKPKDKMAWYERLDGRLKRTIPKKLLQRVHFRPHAEKTDFTRICQLADVLLDTFPFGAGSSLTHFFLVGTPLVTMPGKFFVGRIPYYYYLQMGLEELIANSVDEYVDLAIRVAHMPHEEKEKLRTKIQKAADEKYFDQQVTLDEFRDWIKARVAELPSA